LKTAFYKQVEQNSKRSADKLSMSFLHGFLQEKRGLSTTYRQIS